VKNPANPLIYIIDSNANYRKILSTCLKALKYNNLKTFESCEDCLKTDNTPDIVILDHTMKEYHITGLDFLISYKQKYSDTDFLFFSSDPSVDVAVRSIKWGACDYFIKGRKGIEELIVRFNSLIKSYSVMRRKRIEYNVALVSLGMLSIIFAVAIFLYNF
jgi:DNA-binding NtrC family response regulator